MNFSVSGPTAQVGIIVFLLFVFFPPRQRFLRVLRAVPHHRLRHCLKPECVAGVHLHCEHHPVGLRAVVGGAGQHHHRHDPSQHVWRHVVVEHQPKRRVPSEPGHGEQMHRLTSKIKFNFRGFFCIQCF